MGQGRGVGAGRCRGRSLFSFRWSADVRAAFGVRSRSPSRPRCTPPLRTLHKASEAAQGVQPGCLDPGGGGRSAGVGRAGSSLLSGPLGIDAAVREHDRNAACRSMWGWTGKSRPATAPARATISRNAESVSGPFRSDTKTGGVSSPGATPDPRTRTHQRACESGGVRRMPSDGRSRDAWSGLDRIGHRSENVKFGIISLTWDVRTLILTPRDSRWVPSLERRAFRIGRREATAQGLQVEGEGSPIAAE